MATRYWVGGSGNWDATTTTNWASTSGGAGGASAPTSADDVIIDTSSGTGSISCSSALATCNNITVTASQAITLTGTLSLINGSLSYPSGGSFSSVALLTFIATTTGKTITSNGKSFGNTVTFNGVGGSWQLQDALTSTSTVTLTNGTLDLNSKTLTCNIFNSNNSNTRSISFGEGNITITGTNATILAGQTLTGFTYTGTPTVNITGAGTAAQTRTLNWGSTAGGTESNAVSINVSAGADLISNAAGSVYLNFTFSGTFTGSWSTTQKNIYGNLTLISGMTSDATVGGNISFQSTSATVRTITTANVTLNFGIIYVNGVGGSWQLQDNLTHAGTQVAFSNGTLDINGKTLTTTFFSNTGASTKTLNLGNNGKISTSGGFTTNNVSYATFIGTGTIDMTSSSSKTFAGAGGNYPYTLNQGGSGELIITGTNTFANITNTVQPATITFTAGTTTTVNNWNISGTSGNLVTLGSSTTSTYTIAKTGTNVFSGRYLNISYMTASPTIFSAFNSTNGGNNTGVTFDAAGTYGRISSTGTLYVPPLSTVFDEITQSIISTTKPAFYASQFDEVTNPGVPIRYLNTGIVQTQGIIDEITGIN